MALSMRSQLHTLIPDETLVLYYQLLANDLERELTAAGVKDGTGDLWDYPGAIRDLVSELIDARQELTDLRKPKRWWQR